MTKHHFDDLLFRDISFQQQGNRFRNRPAIFAQEAFPQQAEMLVASFVPGILELNPDFTLSNVNGKRFEIVAFLVEAAATFEIEASTVPVAGEDSSTHRASSQWVAHVRTL